jgi:hypothetical protein
VYIEIMKIAAIILVVLFVTGLAAIWFLYKPLRVVAPELESNVHCMNPNICIDDVLKYQEALNLYEDAFHFVEKSIGPFKDNPRVVFCSSRECENSFGLPSTSLDLWKWGIIIGPRGWLDYYVRHEMIHHRQSEELGFSFLRPKWLIEGMAYSLSGDPRQPLSDPWEKYRTQFEEWVQKVGKEDIWKKAKNIR